MVSELTTIFVQKIKPSDKRREIPDGRIGSLYLVVQPNGKKSWAYRYTFRGTPRKLTFGSYPAIGPKEARERAGTAKDHVAEGRRYPLSKKSLPGRLRQGLTATLSAMSCSGSSCNMRAVI